MPLSLAESQAINKIAEHVRDFLPGKPHPYADQSISFAGAAHRVGVYQFWSSGSKLPAISSLLEKTLEMRRDRFCPLIMEIVRQGMKYRQNKGRPITREEIQYLNELIAQVHFKIPELWDPAFLNSLPSPQVQQKEQTSSKSKRLCELKDELLRFDNLDSQTRGFAFERFLQKLFEVFDLAPRSPFKIKGEQIDGSFQKGSEIYLVEAKWHKQPISVNALLVFREKVESKATWSRGLFISYSGFSQDGLAAFAKGRATNIIGMDGQDLYFILEGKISLVDAITQKTRRAAETGEFFVPVFDLMSGS